MRHLITVCMLICLMATACSKDEPDGQKQGIINDGKGYYYHGNVDMYDGETGKKIFNIFELLMSPSLYGHCIPIPTPPSDCKAVVDLKENSLIEKNSVRYTLDGKQMTADMPAIGQTMEYNGFSISRPADNPDRFDVVIKGYSCKDLEILTRPAPSWWFDDAAQTTEGRFDPVKLGIPVEIPVIFYVGFFRDDFRPILQYHLTTD